MAGISIVGLALTAASSVLGAVQERRAAKSEARAEKQAYALRESDRQRRMQALIGEQKTRYGASGVLGDIGSPVDVYGQTAAEYGREQADDYLNTQRKVNAYETNARNAIPNSIFNLAGTVGGRVLRTKR